MKKIYLFFSLLLLSITVSAQHLKYYHRPRIVYEAPYVDVMYVKKVVKNEPKEPTQIVINNYVVDDNKKRPYKNNNDCEYVSIDTSECLLESPTFSYDDMWSQTIWFKEGSYRNIRTDGKIALDNVAIFLQEHLDAKVVLEGYASRRHGTYSYNKDLASNRLRTISSYLVNVYHINWDRIEMKVIGTDNAKYEIDKWNQCVVINCKQ